MFDLRDTDLTRAKRRESPLPTLIPGDKEKEDDNRDPLDKPDAVEIHSRLLDSYTRELDRQEPNRREMAIDEDFYDNKHWKDSDAREVEDRGQVPLVYNVIATSVNWLLGTEKRGRTDFHVLPRRKEAGKPAEKKTQLLKYLSDCNRTGFHRSRAFGDAVKVGLGWLEDGLWEGGEGEPIYSRYESWRNMLWDSAAVELDLNDGRYTFRSKFVDLDLMKAMIPGRAGLLKRSAEDGERFLAMTGEFGDDAMDAAELDLEMSGSPSRLVNRYIRERLRCIEAWFKRPQRTKKLQGGEFDGEIFDADSPGHSEQVKFGNARVVEASIMRMYLALFTPLGLLYLQPSPYRHNKFPFTPIWGNRRGKDGLPYGWIRGLRDINMDLNKRASKSLSLISTRRTIADEGAVDDMDELADEAARSDAFIVKKPGKEIKIEENLELADAHIHVMERDIMMIQQAGGVTDENLGRKTNATSGIAIERRQDQGATATTHYFDNFRLALQVQGEKQLSLVEQFMTEEKQFRITNMRGKPEYVTVNDGLPENDIARSKADFVISEGDWHATMRQAQAEQLLETMKTLPPEVALVVLDLVVENMDLPNREEIVRRLRDQMGLSDPDADENDENEIARKQAQAQKTQFNQAMEMAQLRKLIAEAMGKEMAALASRAAAVKGNISAIGGPKRGAIDIAADILSGPAIAPVADAILRESGFEGAVAEHAVAQGGGAAQAEAQAQAQQRQQQQANGASDGEA